MAAARPSSMQALLKVARRLPDTEVGVACEGTALESRTVRTRNKAFLFLRPKEARLKLAASLDEASALAAKRPDRCVVGAGGWVQLKLDDATDPIDVFERWVSESHALFAGKPAKPASPAAPASSAKRKKK